MKLQKQRTREVNGKKYYRWTVVIPTEKVQELKWQAGEELDGKVVQRKLILTPKTKS
ncbi:MAG: hypothetical protein WCC17_04995 [Candidatus Nitrosopolaris sp.]|jgi:hypothetical protein